MNGPVRRWASVDNRYTVEIGPSTWNLIVQRCVAVDEIETGGILIGYYSDDLLTAKVTEATPPPRDSIRRTALFQRGVDGLHQLLARRWRNTRRQYYVGEWHYHPSRNVEPSSVDSRQMALISETSAYNCQVPIMLIVGKGNGDNASRLFVFPRDETMIELFPDQAG